MATNPIVDVLIKKNQECEKLKEALTAILMNTLNRDLDPMYKSGVLTNIKMALSEEEYNYLIELYC